MTRSEIQQTLKQFNTFIRVLTNNNIYVSFYYCIDTYKMTLRGVDNKVTLKDIVATINDSQRIKIDNNGTKTTIKDI